MAPVAFSTILLDFSGIYGEESFRPDGAVRLDFSSLEGTECYCDESAAREICRRLEPFPSGGLHWIDGGDYHYVSRFWLEKLERPFELVLLDRHSDDQPSAFGDTMLSCGDWVADARRSLPFLKRDWWIRDGGDPFLSPDAELLRPGLPVYLSIDKDVLSPDWARTNWDQGTMTLPELKGIIARIAAAREVLGIDVCGGLSEAKGACGKDVEINRRTDEELHAFFVSLQTI